jgi:hypothetical protein
MVVRLVMMISGDDSRSCSDEVAGSARPTASTILM